VLVCHHEESGDTLCRIYDTEADLPPIEFRDEGVVVNPSWQAIWR
jgi:hypothetical protein